MSRRVLSVAIRATLILSGGLVAGALAAFAGSALDSGVAWAANAATCTGSGAVTVTINGDSTLTLSEQVNAAVLDLELDGTTNCGSIASLTSITFAVGTPIATATTVTLDQTGGVLPCAVGVGGTIGTGPLQVDAAANETLTFGSTGVNLNGCGSADVALTGVTTVSASATAGPVTVSAAGGAGTGAATTATFNAAPSTQTYTLGGDVNLQGSAGTYPDIASTGTDNQVTAGSGTEAFTVSGDALGLVGGSGHDIFTISSGNGDTIQGSSGGTYTINNGGSGTQVTGGTGTETFTFTGTVPPFVGSSGGTYTLNGLTEGSQVSAGSGTEAFTITGPVTTGTTPGLTGLILSASGSDTFTVTGINNSSNTLNGGSGTSSFTITGSSNTYNGATGTDTVTITGSDNTFVAGSGSEQFFDQGSSNTVNFSNVQTSPSAPLTVNVAGAPETVGSVTLDNGHAAVGSTVSYTFLNSQSSTSASDFTTYIGASTGSTEFLAGGTGGFTFEGEGSGNSAAFFGSSGVAVNISGALQTTSSGFQIGSGQVLVSSPGGVTSCSVTICDSLTDTFTVTGSPGGNSTFYAGAAPNTFTFSDPGDNNTFIGGTGIANFSSGGNNNTFVAGFGTETFSETTSSQEPNNTINFSAVPVGSTTNCTGGGCILIVNVSGAHTAVPTYGAAVINSAQTQLATYSFGNGGPDFTNFIGAAGGNTTFDGGSGNYTYLGQGAGNTLDFSEVSSSVATTLTFDVTHSPSPQATLGTVPETFSGVTNLVGLATGGTTFVGGSTGGFTFNGNGSGNQAIFSAQGPSATLTVKVVDPRGGSNPVTSGTVTFSLAGGGIVCSNVPVSSNGTASCYATSLPAGVDQIVAFYTPVTGSSDSGSGVVISVTGTVASTATKTTTVLSIPSGSLFQGVPITLSATVTVSGGAAATSGTVTFSLAGGGTLCADAPVSGSGTASCLVSSLPAGTFDILAVYTPANGLLQGSVGTSPPAGVTVNPPFFTTVSSLSYQSECTLFEDCLSATVNVDPGYVGVVSGTLTFTSPDLGFLCSVGVGGAGPTGCEAFTLFGLGAFDDEQIVAVFTPSSSEPLSGSAATLDITTQGDTCCDTFTSSTTTSLVSSQTTFTVGTVVTLTATISIGSSPVPPPGTTLAAGTVTFSIAGGVTLCTVPVPGGLTIAIEQCSASFPAGPDQVLATYSPSGISTTNTTAGSSFVIALTVSAPTPTGSSGSAPTEDLDPGVVVNLSGTTKTTPATDSVPNVQVLPNQVLVAAPSAGITSCAGTPVPTFCDDLVDITVVTGSSLGDNTFIAGIGSQTFADTGTAGGDTIDFSNVPTSSSTLLTVNVSGGPVNGENNFTATVGSSTYLFTSGGADFTSFSGSASGNTVFLASSTPGYSFTAIGSGNSIDFSAATSGVVVDLSHSPPTTPISGTVQVATGTCPTACDAITGLTTVIGSALGGNTFKAGPLPFSYNFTGNGNGNTFIGYSGTSPNGGIDVFSSNGNNNIFKAGTGDATFTDTGSHNTVDFSGLSGADDVVVDVSGQPVGSMFNGTATDSNLGTTYTFSSFATAPTTFVGSPGGTTFEAGSPADTFNGSALAASGANILTFADASGSSLLVCLVTGSGCTGSPQAVLGTIKEPFANITVFDGLPGGNTTFVTGNPAGDVFNATGSNNSADYSHATRGVTVNLSAGTSGTVSQAGDPESDTITGLTTVTGYANGGNSFTAGPAPFTYTFTGNGNGNTFTGGTGIDIFSSNGSSNTFAVGAGAATLSDTGSGNTIDFNEVSTSSSTPLTVNVSGTPVGVVGNDTATVGSVIYNFTTGGAGFTTFDGAGSGNTHFDAPGATGGYTFTGAPGSANNTADFSANLTGITVNLSPTTEAGLTTGQVSVGAGTPDTIAGITSVIGSPQGPNVFYGGLKGTAFSAASTTNTLSYLGLASGVTVNLKTDQVTGTGTADTFSFAPGTLTIEGSAAGHNTFIIGTATVFLEGGGPNDTLDLSQVTTAGVVVNLATGSVAGTSIGGVTFTPGCSSATELCVTAVKGSPFADDFIANPTQAVTITGNGGADTLDLSEVPGAAIINMKTGTVNTPAITFTGIANVIGTMGGSDTFIVGTGTEGFTENGTPGTLDFSQLPTAGSAGVSVSVVDIGSTFSGSVTSPGSINANDTFSGISTFIGTPGNDSFTQSGVSPALGYTFEGEGGSNTLTLPADLPATVTFTQPVAGDMCSSGVFANDGTAEGSGISDTFSCMTNVGTTGTETFIVNPGGQQPFLNGGGVGTLELLGDVMGGGVVIVLPNGSTPGSVTGDGYNFEFIGMAIVDGTPFNDLFIPGSGNVTINGEGGGDGVSFAGAAGAVVVNLSNSAYTIPAGFSGAGTTVPSFTAIGGNGGVITLNGISNIIGTVRFDDILIAGSGSGTLIGGSGTDRFVLTGGDYFINGGTGASTLDLSELPGSTQLDLGSSALQFLGAGSVEIVPGTIETVIASPGGSQLSAGPGNITLVGGTGNDWLAAGDGTQTLMGNGGSDTLIAGVGTDSLVGGAQPVTFVPGSGGTDTLSSLTTGNTLSYSGAPSAVQINLSTNLVDQLTPQTATGGWGASVNLTGANITIVLGTSEADTLVTGTAGGDIITGNGGNDVFIIVSGNNTLTAGTASDSRFIFEAPGSNNILNGGGDSTVDFSQATAGVNVNLQLGTATGGFGGTQTLRGILNAIGTNFADVLVAGAPGGVLIGLNAEGCAQGQSCGDVLQAGTSGGDTLISDGNGNDTFCAQSSCAVRGTVAGGGDTMTGGSGDDTFFAANGLVDAINGGGGTDTAFVDPTDKVTDVSQIVTE